MSDEPTNSDRSDWAQSGLCAFAEQTGQIKDFKSGDADAAEEVIHDFLCDLMHYCDGLGLEFNHLATNARECYLEEKEADEN